MESGNNTSVILVFRAPNGDIRETEISEIPLVIGRDESADLRVDDKRVSRRHASFRILDGSATVEDLGSVNGALLNGVRIEGSAAFGPGDLVSVGGFEIWIRGHEPDGVGAPAEGISLPPEPGPLLTSRKLVGTSSPVAGKTFELGDGENDVGRAAECVVSIVDASVSRKHALVLSDDGSLRVRDLESYNGTFVNDRSVSTAELYDGDALRFGSVGFRVICDRQRPMGVRGLVRRRAGAWNAKLIIGAVLFGALVAVALTTSWPQQIADYFASLGGEGPLVNTIRSDAGSPDAGVSVASPDAGRSVAAAVPAVSKPRREPDTKSPDAAAKPGPRTGTSTSPYSRKDAEGLPVGLPQVDETFDLLAFLKQQNKAADAALKDGDEALAQEALRKVLDVDPLNDDVQARLEEVDQALRSRKLMEEATTHVAKDELYLAFRKFSLVAGQEGRLAEEATRHGAEIKAPALEARIQEIRGMRETDARKAHTMLVELLGLAPQNAAARKEIFQLERALRARGEMFSPWHPNPDPETQTDREAQKRVMRNHFSDPKVADAILRYVDGFPQKALSELRALHSASAEKAVSRLAALSTTARSVRELASQDPDQAWAKFLEFEASEESFLPPNLPSASRLQLAASIADALSDLAVRRFEDKRHEEAFSRWDAALKLSPIHMDAAAGLERLDQHALELLKAAAVAVRGGEDGICERYRSISRITRPSSSTHNAARKNIATFCK